MNLFLSINYSRLARATSEFSDFKVAMLFFTPLVLGIAYLIYANIKLKNSKWANGIFPDKLPFNRDNLLEAYICLAARIIQKDRRDIREKIAYLNTYFLKHFTENTYNFSDSLSWSFKNPIDPKTVAFWIHKHIKEESKRQQVLYFLVGISMVDGQLVESEYTILKEITPLLKLTIKDLDAIVNMYAFKEDKKQNAQNQSTNGTYKKEKALKIFALDLNASLEEVKMAYRKLVKIHHPDRFSNESQEQQKLAHERFIQIQEAYEYLENLMS